MSIISDILGSGRGVLNFLGLDGASDEDQQNFMGMQNVPVQQQALGPPQQMQGPIAQQLQPQEQQPQEQQPQPPRPMSRTDAAPLAQPGPGDRSTFGLMFNPHNDAEKSLGRAAMARFLSQGDFAKGVGAAMAGRDEDARNPVPLDEQRRQLDVDALRQKIELGDLIEVGDGVLYDRKTGQSTNPPPATMEAYRKIQSIKARGLGSGGAGSGMQHAQAFQGPDGDIAYSGVEGTTPVMKSVGTGKNVPRDQMNLYRPLVQANRNFSTGEREEYNTNNEVALGAESAITTLEQIGVMRASFPGAAATGVPGDVARWLAENSGMDTAGINLADKQTFTSSSKAWEAGLTRQFLANQGAITEGERAGIRAIIPSLGTDPKAFNQILDIYSRLANSSITKQRAWVEYKGRSEEKGNQPSKSLFDSKFSSTRKEDLDGGFKDSARVWGRFNSWASGAATPSTSPSQDKAPAAQPAPVSGQTKSGIKWSVRPSGPAGGPEIPIGSQGVPPAAFDADTAPRDVVDQSASTPRQFGSAIEGPTVVRAAPQAVSQEQSTRDLLIQKSRGTFRGQEYAKMADSARSMIAELKTTKDPHRRRAIVAALKANGIIRDGE